MMTFLTHLINGISLGSIYAIIALGYTMVYGIAKMLNFAHGDVIMGPAAGVRERGTEGLYKTREIVYTISMNHGVSRKEDGT